MDFPVCTFWRAPFLLAKAGKFKQLGTKFRQPLYGRFFATGPGFLYLVKNETHPIIVQISSNFH